MLSAIQAGFKVTNSRMQGAKGFVLICCAGGVGLDRRENQRVFFSLEHLAPVVNPFIFHQQHSIAFSLILLHRRRKKFCRYIISHGEILVGHVN